MRVHVFATLQPKPEHREAIEAELKALVSITRKEPGNLSYDLFTQTEGDLAFYLIESYLDEIAFEVHRSSDHYRDYREKTAKWLSSAPSVTILRPLDVVFGHKLETRL